jgi:hypothetical protein
MAPVPVPGQQHADRARERDDDPAVDRARHGAEEPAAVRQVPHQDLPLQLREHPPHPGAGGPPTALLIGAHNGKRHGSNRTPCIPYIEYCVAYCNQAPIVPMAAYGRLWSHMDQKIKEPIGA